jgi:hypothetical protein
VLERGVGFRDLGVMGDAGAVEHGVLLLEEDTSASPLRVFSLVPSVLNITPSDERKFVDQGGYSSFYPRILWAVSLQSDVVAVSRPANRQTGG